MIRSSSIYDLPGLGRWHKGLGGVEVVGVVVGATVMEDEVQ